MQRRTTTTSVLLICLAAGGAVAAEPGFGPELSTTINLRASLDDRVGVDLPFDDEARPPMRARLSLENAQGVELAWIEGPLVWLGPASFGGISDFDFVLPDDGELAELLNLVDGDLFTGDRLRFTVERPTSLRDGGIGGAASSVRTEDAGNAVLAGYAAGDGEFDLYNLSLEWQALNPGPLSVTLIGGVKAIRAVIGQMVTDSSGLESYASGRAIVAVPVVGGGLRFDFGDGVFVSSSATAQPYAGGTSMFDFTAETGIDFDHNIGFRAGYQFIHSMLEIQSLDTELSQQGIFARLVIKF